MTAYVRMHCYNELIHGRKPNKPYYDIKTFLDCQLPQALLAADYGEYKWSYGVQYCSAGGHHVLWDRAETSAEARHLVRQYVERYNGHCLFWRVVKIIYV